MLRDVPQSKAGDLWAAQFYGERLSAIVHEPCHDSIILAIAREAFRRADKVLRGERGERLVIGEDGRLMPAPAVVGVSTTLSLVDGHRVEVKWEDGRTLTKRFAAGEDGYRQAIDFRNSYLCELKALR